MKKRREWSLQRNVPLTGAIVFFVLGAVIAVLAFLLTRHIIYEEYNDRLAQVITYIEHNADADDLNQCIHTGEMSAKYEELQAFLNNMVDDLELEYVYIVIPHRDKMVNVVSGTNAEEFAAGEENMPLLEVSNAYTEKELARYIAAWNAEGITYFEESSEYGTYYTACKPLRTEEGQVVALICADLSSESLHRDLRVMAGVIVPTLALLVGIFGLALLALLRNKATRPILDLVRSAQAFAEDSEGIPEVEALHFKKPAIHGSRELAELSDAIEKMADNMRDYIAKTLAAEAYAHETEQVNLRLTEKARAERRIGQLTESMQALLANMPAMTFSKDVETGRYLACNQLFADSVGRANPADVVGAVDADLYAEEAARHFAETDEIALSMTTPYVYVEDVMIAEGIRKQYQTTKLQFRDSSGRRCILGMCIDTTELMFMRQQSTDAQRAFEQARNASLTYANIARALAMDYSFLYYVNLENNRFIEYHSDQSSEDLALERRGEDFFEQSLADARHRIYPADQYRFFEVFSRENILDTIDKHGVFTLSYRLMIDDTPTYVNMKISRMLNDANHLVVGVSNVDAQMRIQEEVERAREERVTYARITALSGNFICIYTVDPETKHYVEYDVSRDYERLGLQKSGDDFFAVTAKEAPHRVFDDDLDRFLQSFTMENVMREVEESGLYMLDYRLMLGGEPLYVSLRAALVQEEDGPQLVVGICNVDAQIKREQEYARRLSVEHTKANVDALTGLGNKHAYVDMEDSINRWIDAGEQAEFAIAVLDINGLKMINDTQGHRKGDEFIMQAAKMIMSVFTLSLVYRVGGDEFVVIAQDSDYQHIDELMAQLAEDNERNLAEGGVVVACGMARFAGDKRVSAVFERADQCMYVNKKNLKEGK